MTVLLERDDCLDELDAALREAATGDGRIALVCGEAGIGKTSLVERFVALRRRGMRTLLGRCDSLFTPQPLGPLHDMAAQLPIGLQELLPSTLNRLAIFAALLRELQHSREPSIAVFEDVHWADAATLDLLKYLGRRLQGVRALLILTYRDDEIDREHPLWSVLGNLPSSMVRRLPLPPLSEAAVATLARPAGRAAHEVYALTGGNPFFVAELLASPGETVPATIREATLARAVRASPAARTVLDICAVVPTRVDRWLLKMTLDPPASVLDECARTGLLVVEHDALRFRHELTRQAVESALPTAHAQALHARILQALLGRGRDAVPLARIVHHAIGAEDDAAVREYAPAAARQAALLGAHREAAAHYETALRVTDPADAGTRASLFESRAVEAYLTGQMEAAFEAAREALALRRRRGERAKEGEDLRWLSRFAWFLGRHTEAMAHAEDSIRVLETLPPGSEVAMAYSNRAQLHMLSVESRQAVHWGHRALKLAGWLSLLEVEIHALNNVGAAELQRCKGQGWIHLERSLQLALANDMHDHAARAYTNLAWQAVVDRDYGRAKRYLEDGLAYTMSRDLDSWTLYMLGVRARSNLEQGRWQQAAIDAGAVLEASRAALLRINALLVLGLVRVRRGDPGGDELFDEARTLALPTDEVMRIGPTAAARAEAAWLKGHSERCREEARIGYKLALRHRDAQLIAQLGYWVRRGGGTPQPQRRTATTIPFARQIGGDWQAAAAQWQRLGCPYEEALALAEGDSFARLRSLAILDELGARPAAALLRRSLRAQGVRQIPRGVRPATRRNPAGLTAREMEILKLLVDGLSNRCIAEQLCISTKTVDHHVSAVLAKLDVESREQAATLAISRGLLVQDGEASAPR